VTIIDRNDRLMHREDDDVTEALDSLFEDEGIDIILNAQVKGVSDRSRKSVRIVMFTHVSVDDFRVVHDSIAGMAMHPPVIVKRDMDYVY
jgi:NADPH-dependent 2,4-dienoyl-CoA reductase/sulfur reductase-like enzyme